MGEHHGDQHEAEEGCVGVREPDVILRAGDERRGGRGWGGEREEGRGSGRGSGDGCREDGTCALAGAPANGR